MSKYFFSSLTRISDLAEEGFNVDPWERTDWGTGDYVVGRVVGRAGQFSRVELRTGRMIEVVEGDLVVGAWGSRRATLEAVGDWMDIGDDGMFNAMTSAGLFGRVTSLAPLMPPLMRLRYVGHVTRDGSKMTMSDFIPPIPEISYDKVENVRGMNVTIVTTARTDEEGLALLKNMGMPFKRRSEQA